MIEKYRPMGENSPKLITLHNTNNTYGSQIKTENSLTTFSDPYSVHMPFSIFGVVKDVEEAKSKSPIKRRKCIKFYLTRETRKILIKRGNFVNFQVKKIPLKRGKCVKFPLNAGNA
jgi:hypothetical protein